MPDVEGHLLIVYHYLALLALGYQGVCCELGHVGSLDLIPGVLLILSILLIHVDESIYVMSRLVGPPGRLEI